MFMRVNARGAHQGRPPLCRLMAVNRLIRSGCHRSQRQACIGGFVLGCVGAILILLSLFMKARIEECEDCPAAVTLTPAMFSASARGASILQTSSAQR
jgi:hypothetical protein